MKTLLLNDTRSDKHIGCELVISNTYRLAKARGLEIIATIENSEALNAPDILKSFTDKVDLVLLNGEGTLHHDRPKALALLEACKIAKLANLPVVLYNALWTDNVKANEYLRFFDLIYCRDSLSAKTVKEASPSSHIEFVPDLSFASPLPGNVNNQIDLMVSDSIRKKICKSLAWYSIKTKSHFYPMGDSFYTKFNKKRIIRFLLEKRAHLPPKYTETPESYLSKLLSSESVITGRFHTVCLCILSQTPVCAIPSNTKKIEILYKDFGLDPTTIPNKFPTNEEMELQWSEQKTKRDHLNKMVSKAQLDIEAMFDKISSI